MRCPLRHAAREVLKLHRKLEITIFWGRMSFGNFQNFAKNGLQNAPDDLIPKFPIYIGTFWSLGMENIVIFCGHLEYSIAIWYILRTFGDFAVIRYIFPRFGKLYQDKSGNPAIFYKKI
jgi:hypothetical protein